MEPVKVFHRDVLTVRSDQWKYYVETYFQHRADILRVRIGSRPLRVAVAARARFATVPNGRSDLRLT